MDRPRIGIVREWKTPLERRAPLTPTDVAQLIDEGADILVEPSPHRVYSDAEYEASGAVISEDLADADLLVGIKEIPAERLHDGKPHLFFSHTIKGQPYNMKLLEEILNRRCTLLDYELVRDEAGHRLIFFGVQAGQAGMINSLWTLGQRLLSLGHMTPLAALKQARHYASLDEARSAIGRVAEEVGRRGLPAEIGPLVIGITGAGNVSRGAQEIAALLDPRAVTPDQLLGGVVNANSSFWTVVFPHDTTVETKGPDDEFSRAFFEDHPERFRNRFDDYLPHLSLLVTGHFWRPQDPPMVTVEALKAMFAGPERPRLIAIGDVTADVDGSIECTREVTTPDRPTYIYDPSDHSLRHGFEGPGLAVMAVDILPTEIPRESSMAFGRFLTPYLLDVASADYSQPLESLDLPAPFQRALIAHQGSLTPDHAGLALHLDG